MKLGPRKGGTNPTTQIEERPAPPAPMTTGRGMKWVRSDGLSLVIRDVGPPLVRLAARRPTGTPLPLRDDILSDDEARHLLRGLLAMGVYDRLPDIDK